MHCVREDDSLLYWVSNFDGLSRTGREKGCVIRSVRSVSEYMYWISNVSERINVREHTYANLNSVLKYNGYTMDSTTE